MPGLAPGMTRAFTQNSDFAAAAAESNSGAGTKDSTRTNSAETSRTVRTPRSERSKAGFGSSNYITLTRRR